MINPRNLLFSMFIIFVMTVAIFLIVFVCGVIGHQIWIAKDKGYAVNFFGAFSGAFFAFLFMSVTSAGNKLFERRLKHRNAIVRLEWVLNSFLEIIDCNCLHIDECIKAFQNERLFILNFRDFSVEKTIGDDLLNIDLKNDVMSLTIDTDRLNADYSSVKQYAHPDIIKRQTQDVINSLKTLRDGHIKIDEEMEILMAKVRFILSKPSLLDRIIMLFSKAEKYPRNIQQGIEKELAQVKKERNDTQEKSRIRWSTLEKEG